MRFNDVHHVEFSVLRENMDKFILSPVMPGINKSVPFSFIQKHV